MRLSIMWMHYRLSVTRGRSRSLSNCACAGRPNHLRARFMAASSWSVTMAKKKLQLQKPKGATSAVWNHFGFEINESGQRVDKKAVHCKLYDKSVRYSNNTTNLKQHLLAWHQEVLSKSKSSKSQQQTTIETFSRKELPKLPRGSKRAQDICNSISYCWVCGERHASRGCCGGGGVSQPSCRPGSSVPIKCHRGSA